MALIGVRRRASYYRGMRKQYHPLPSEEGLRVWDVDRLIELAEELPVELVRVNEIWELDEVRWFVEEQHPPTCRAVLEHMRLVLESDPSYPILLGEDGRVMDGMHRILKVALEGRDTIPAKRFERDPEPDYIGVELDELPY